MVFESDDGRNGFADVTLFVPNGFVVENDDCEGVEVLNRDVVFVGMVDCLLTVVDNVSFVALGVVCFLPSS